MYSQPDDPGAACVTMVMCEGVTFKQLMSVNGIVAKLGAYFPLPVLVPQGGQ